MRKISTFSIVFLISIACLSQTPAGFSYQAVLRDNNGQVLGGQAAQLRVTLTSSNGLTTHYQELHDVTSSAQGLINVIIGDGTGKVGVLVDVPWGNDQVTLKTEIKVGSATTYTELGSQPLQAVPYALYANNAKEVESSPAAGDDDPIFVVKNKLGQIVFAVYQEGVRVFVDDGTTKGAKGGFAVGGLSGTKESVEYLRITPDSARIWVNEGSKGAKGGFAVGGLSGTKTISEYLSVTPDSTRIYVNDQTKGAKGGFAVGGLSGIKGNNHFFDVSTDATGIINPSQNRVLWYPLKNAFLAGRVLIDAPESVGENSFAVGYESKSAGMYSQAMGYKAIATGDYSTAIGKDASASASSSFAFGTLAVASGASSVAIGDNARTTKTNSFAFGYNALADGLNSLALGFSTTSQGQYSTAMGYQTKSTALGATATGYQSEALSNYSFAGGYVSKTNVANDTYSQYPSASNGLGATAIGYQTEAKGDGALALGYQSKATAPYSSAVGGYRSEASAWGASALGDNSKAYAEHSTALGYKAESHGTGSVAIGAGTKSYGGYSFASGNNTIARGLSAFSTNQGAVANGAQSFSANLYTKANGAVSTAFGNGVYSNSYACFALGQFNDTISMTSATDWIPTDPILVVGNGADNTSRSNALTLLKNGMLTIAGTLTQSSDLRLKDNILPLENVLTKIMNINPIYFEFKDKKTHPAGRHIGFTAQEFENTFPELVSKDNNGYLSVEYQNVSAVLLQAIKEQQKIIENQQSEINSLKDYIKEIEMLKADLEALKKIIAK